jgi:hypothetical protein
MIRQLSSGGIITNYTCSAACAHCLYKSSPTRDPGYITSTLLSAMLRKAASLGCRSFHIGGGESFLDVEGLLATIRTIREEQATIDYLETNAFWYSTDSAARRLLERIQKAGCDTLMISVCPFHIEYVPLMHVEGVRRACEDVGMRYFLWQEQYLSELARLDKQTTHTFGELAAVFGDDYLPKAAARYGLRLNGRALRTLQPYLRRRPAERVVAEAIAAESATGGGGCPELRSVSHFHLDLYGNYIPPGCVGLVLDYRLLGSDIPETHQVLRLLDRQGIGGLLDLARREYGFNTDPAGYSSKCELCLAIREYLVLHQGGTTGHPGLGPEDFYRNS